MNAYSITLRVVHPARTFEDVIEALGWDPASGHTVGTPRQSITGALLDGVHSETIAPFKLCEQVEGKFVDGIRDVLSTIEPHREHLRGVVETGGRLMLYIGVFIDEHLGFQFDLELLKSLSSMGIEVGVEIYPA